MFRKLVFSFIMAVIMTPVLAQGAGAPSYTTTRTDTVSLFNEIYFHFDKFDLDKDYLSNRETLDEIMALIDSIPDDSLLQIEVISQSSPEGAYEHNMWLSDKRSMTMSEYMRNTYPELIGRMVINPDGESWDKLRKYVEQDQKISEKTRTKILGVIDADVNIATKKWRMQNILGTDPAVGDVYKYLYKQYYKIIRLSGISIHYVKKTSIAGAGAGTGISAGDTGAGAGEGQGTGTGEGGDVTGTGTGTGTEKETGTGIGIGVEVGTGTKTDEGQSDDTGTDEGTGESTDETTGEGEGADSTSAQGAVEQAMRVPVLALKTNLLYDAFFYPTVGYSPVVNLKAEYYFPRRNWSVQAEMEFPWWSRDEEHYYFQINNYQLEVRKYLAKGTDHSGHYLSLYGMYNLYDICFDTENANGIQGEGAGLGIGYGYNKRLGKSQRWKLDLHIQAGYYETHYDDYEITFPYNGKYYYKYVGDPDLFVPRNQRFRWFGPTGVGVTLSYDLLFRNLRINKE